MGMLGGLVKAGIAKKVFDEARKPHNQAKAKEMLAKLKDKKSGGTSGTTRTTR